MNKQLREMLEKINNKKSEAKQLLAQGKIEDAKAMRDEIKNLEAEFDIAKDLYEDERNNAQNAVPVPQPKNEKPEYKDVFMKAIKGRKLTEVEMSVMEQFKAALSEKTGADGGYIVPEDISTAINKLKMTVDNLEQYVNVQPVSTNKGSRVLEKRADSTHPRMKLQNGTGPLSPEYRKEHSSFRNQTWN
jgi:HK97 family phage major capsid protein